MRLLPTNLARRLTNDDPRDDMALEDVFEAFNAEGRARTARRTARGTTGSAEPGDRRRDPAPAVAVPPRRRARYHPGVSPEALTLASSSSRSPLQPVRGRPGEAPGGRACVVIESPLGMLIGPHLLGWAHLDEVISRCWPRWAGVPDLPGRFRGSTPTR
ncbi:MAG: hypothetical protein R2713_10610 [Ilumatobacteraceae bacterium]